MVEIIPAILAKTKESLLEQIAQVKHLVEYIHVDIMDGEFVTNLTITPEKLKEIQLPMIVHLMAKDDTKYLKELFLNNNVKTIILHPEGKKDLKKNLMLIKKSGRKTGIALKPKTQIKEVSEYFHIVDEVLIMTVEPGFQGQKFKEKPLEKIKPILKLKKIVSCDGGINFETAQKIIATGASRLYIGSAIFTSSNIEKTLTKFQNT